MSDISQHPLRRYDNAHVQVHYNIASGVQDTGTLTYRDDHWVELLNAKGEYLLIPMSAIRIIKLLDKPDPNADAQMLLRAAGDAPQKQINK